MRAQLKRRLSAAVLIAAAGLPGALPRAHAAALFNDPSDVKQITAVEIALNVETDMKRLIGFYAPDAFVLDMLTDGAYQGRKQIEASFAKQFESVKSMKTDVQDMNIASDGKFACVAQRVSFHTSMKDGSTLDLSVRQLDALKKIGGKWQIIQQHISVPSDPNTGMAVMNAKLPVRGAAPWTEEMFAGASTTPAKAKEEIRNWVLANAPLVDVDQMVATLGPGKLALMYDLTVPGEYRGTQEIREGYAPLMNQLSSARIKLLKFEADSDGLFAAQIDTQNLLINFKNGKSKIITYRESDCLHRVDGQWKSFAEEISFPFDPKTGKSYTVDPAASFK